MKITNVRVRVVEKENSKYNKEHHQRIRILVLSF